VWRQLAGPTYGAYESNPISINAGDTGTFILRLEGFSGFASASLNSATSYGLSVVHGADTLGLTCVVSGTSCSSAASSGPINGLTISNFSMTESTVDLVAAFATSAAPGQGPNTGTDLVVSFDYSVAAVPEPSTMAIAAAGLSVLALLRRRATKA
jgi:hypothetical protein